MCVLPAAGVVGEAMVAIVLADAMRVKFGGDSLDEALRNFRVVPGGDMDNLVLVGFSCSGKTTLGATWRGGCACASSTATAISKR